MIHVYFLDRLLAEVSLIEGSLAITSHDGPGVTKFISESLREFVGETLTELYASLPGRLRGMTWAGVSPQETSLLHTSKKFCENMLGRTR
jgi:hypothetical protein